MKDHPILFQPAMVRALIAGMKTQTRRTRQPRWVKGDRLWVRESFRKLENASDHPSEPIHYMADGEPATGHWTGGKPSIHMPRWANRIVLTVEEVREEPLQHLTYPDAMAEGVIILPSNLGQPDGGFGVYGVPEIHALSATNAYYRLWDHINGKGSAAKNPIVYATTFSVEMKNIDA